MARRNKTKEQQEKYYEVERDFFAYLVDVRRCGNHKSFYELYREMNKETRQSFIQFLIDMSEDVSYAREIFNDLAIKNA